MTQDDVVGQILRALRTSLEEIPKSVAALKEKEVRGEAANGAVRVTYGALGDLKRVEVEPEFLHSAPARRIEAALLEAFGQAERAAGAARADFGSDLTLLGLPIGAALRGGSVTAMLPPVGEISGLFEAEPGSPGTNPRRPG